MPLTFPRLGDSSFRLLLLPLPLAALLAALCLSGCSVSVSDKGSPPPGSQDGGTPEPDDGGAAALGASTAAQAFGSLAVGASSGPANILVTNTGTGATGPLSVSLAGASTASFGIDSDQCSGKALAPESSCAVTLHFAPTAAGADTAALTITGAPGGSVTIPLSGTATTPGAVVVAPFTDDFGVITVGHAAAAQTFTVTNAGEEATGSLATSLEGDSADFSIADDGCTVPSLGPGQTCTVSVAFAPSTAGSKAASLNVTGTPGGTASAALAGTAVTPGALSITGAVTAFAPTTLGSQSALTFTVHNTGGTPTGTVALGLSGTNVSEFAITSTTCAAALPGGGSCTADVTFTPASAGAATVTLLATTSPDGEMAALAITASALTQAFLQYNTPPGFFSVAVGQTGSFVVTLTNTGGVPTGPLSISFDSLLAFSFDAAETTCTTSPIPSGGSCTIGVAFAPPGIGGYTTTLLVGATPGGMDSIPFGVTGTAPASIYVSPTRVVFPGTLVGQTSATELFTVENPGSVSTADGVTASITGTGASQFAVVSNTCASQPVPPNQSYSCYVTVAFAPTVSGAASATLTVGADPTIATVSAGLSGTGE